MSSILGGGESTILMLAHWWTFQWNLVVQRFTSAPWRIRFFGKLCTLRNNNASVWQFLEGQGAYNETSLGSFTLSMKKHESHWPRQPHAACHHQCQVTQQSQWDALLAPVSSSSNSFVLNVCHCLSISRLLTAWQQKKTVLRGAHRLVWPVQDCWLKWL